MCPRNSPVLARLVELTLLLLHAAERKDDARLRLLASQIRRLGWNHALPALASAAGALAMAIDDEPTSRGDTAVAIQSIAYEVQLTLMDK